MAKKSTSKQPIKSKPNLQANNSQSKILKNLASRLSDDYRPDNNKLLDEEGVYQDPEVTKINRVIDASAKKISQKEEEKQEKAEEKESKPSIDPPKFDGISNSKEKKTLVTEQVKHLERENLKLKHEMELLKEDFEKEKNNLKKNVTELKRELHRTAPLTDNKLFSFSKELRHVATTVQALSDQEKNNSSNQEPTSDIPDDLALPKPSIEGPSSTLEKSTASPKKVISTQESNISDSTDKKDKPKKNKIKLSKNQQLAGGVTASALLAFIALGLVLNRNNQADNQLALAGSNAQETGQVQGTSDENGVQEVTTPPEKKEQKNNLVSYDETKWETYRDEFLGFQVQYPDNTTDLLRTNNSITFLRKDGYIFKIQSIYSEKTLEEYWEDIKDDGLQYEMEQTKLSIWDALHLKLMEEIEFPGNRYLVKSGEYIFDIWYANPSNHLDEDDIKRVDFMIESVRFL